MGLVINDMVKMEWQEDLWLQTKGRNGKTGAFVYCTKEYTKADGTVIPVHFNAECAFMWDEEPDKETPDLWTAAELRDFVKKERDGAFPNNFDQFVALISNGDEDCKEDVLKRYGLEEFKADIEARRKDLMPFAVETIITM